MTDEDLRVGIIGVGMMGADHAERVAHRTSGARLVAVSDPDTARAGALADGFDGVRVIGDPLALVADDEVDAVVIASPGFVHEEQVLACLEAGKHVLCEKPLTMDERVLAARAAGRALGRATARAAGLHAPLRPRVRPAEGGARLRAGWGARCCSTTPIATRTSRTRSAPR